jgi:hypothetical protein
LAHSGKWFLINMGILAAPCAVSPSLPNLFSLKPAWSVERGGEEVGMLGEKFTFCKLTLIGVRLVKVSLFVDVRESGEVSIRREGVSGVRVDPWVN